MIPHFRPRASTAREALALQRVRIYTYEIRDIAQSPDEYWESRAELVRAKRKRNSRILELHKQGVSRSDIAARHCVTNGRIAQIVAATSPVEQRQTDLAARYGKKPDFARLSDNTPLDVLILAQSDTHGWAVRILALSSGRKPIRTLGELRTMSDEELFSRRGVGTGLLAEIRAICPRTPSQRDERGSKNASRKVAARPSPLLPRTP